jgi:effector-binding domain-containing protein
MDVNIVELPEQPTAVVREAVAVNALPEFFGRAFATVNAALEAANVQAAGPPFAHYLGMPTETVDVEAGFPISTAVTTATEVRASRLPACRAAQALHVGSYDTIGTTYEAVTEQMRREGMKPAEDMWEYYLTEPSVDPATQQTLIVVPVQS